MKTEMTEAELVRDAPTSTTGGRMNMEVERYEGELAELRAALDRANERIGKLLKSNRNLRQEGTEEYRREKAKHDRLLAGLRDAERNTVKAHNGELVEWIRAADVDAIVKETNEPNND